MRSPSIAAARPKRRRRWPSGSSRRAAGPPSSRATSPTGLPWSAWCRRPSAPSGPLTLLVNNASEFEPDEVETLSQERWDRHFAVNLRAPAFLARDFAHQLPADGRGQHRQHRRPARLEAHAAVLFLHPDEGGPVQRHADHGAGARAAHPRQCHRAGSHPVEHAPGRRGFRQAERRGAAGPWRNAGRDRRCGALSGGRATASRAR